MDFIDLMEHCAPNVSPVTMAAIVEQESGFNPYAIGVNGDYILERQPQTKEEAIETVLWLEQEGQKSLDLGLGQISTKNREHYELSLNDSFDACKNLSVAADILTKNYASAIAKGFQGQDALTAAISQYNTGSITAGFENGYVQKVVSNVSPEAIQVPSLSNKVAPVQLEAHQTVSIKKYPPESIYHKDNADKESYIHSATDTQRSELVYR